MIRQTKNNIDRVDFDSFEEFLQFMKDNKGKTKCNELSSENSEFAFCHSKSFDDAIKIAENGWSDGANLIKTVLDKIDIIGKATTFSPVYQVSGESVDVGRFLSGEPENMLEWELIEAEGKKVVDVYFNTIASVGYSTTALINYGAVCLSVVDYLESIGCRVNLYSYYSFANTRGGDQKRFVCVKVKSATESLNIPACAFALAHPSMMRRFMFKCLEAFEKFHTFGYGNVLEFEKESIVLNDSKESIVFQTINNTRCYFNNEQTTSEYLKTRLPNILNELEISNETDFSFIN